MVYDKKYSTQNIVYIAIAIGCAVFFLNQLWEFYHDDTYIVLTYSRNLLEGNGLVWNPGERTEGYTTFLWVVLWNKNTFSKLTETFARQTFMGE